MTQLWANFDNFELTSGPHGDCNDYWWTVEHISALWLSIISEMVISLDICKTLQRSHENMANQSTKEGEVDRMY